MDSDRSPVVVWFRSDLRLDDHPALNSAVATGRQIVPLVVIDDRLALSPTMSQRRWQRFESAVGALDRDLRRIGGRLILRRGDPRVVIPGVVQEVGADEVYASRDLTPYALRRDEEIGLRLRLRLFSGALVVEPEATGPVRIFTPFHRRWVAVAQSDPVAPPTSLDVPDRIPSEAVPAGPPAGGPEALARLREFATRAPGRYEMDRHRLDVDGTSSLSVDFHFGTLSARRAMSEVGSPAFSRQLAWRDWAHHLLWYERAARSSLTTDRLGEVDWLVDRVGVDAWREGRTGFPTVDAAMRQLSATGTMHNRARMIVGSFLTKDLLVDWRVGEAHFLRHLIDADIANNRLGWRWVAGVGPDAAPFIRVLNPSLQGERFDPHGTWTRRWVPEVAHLPDATIHRPWLAKGGGPDGYPAPIVDHLAARQRAIRAFTTRRRS